MPDDVVIEITSHTAVTITPPPENRVVLEQELAPNEIYIEVERTVGNVEIISPPTEYVLEILDGDIFIAKVDQELAGTRYRQAVFEVQYDGQHQFNIIAAALRIFHVMVNQIDYVRWCAITPAGSGQVVYVPPLNGYEFEAGDIVVIDYAE